MLGITCLVLSFFVETIFVFGATILVKYKVSTGGVYLRFIAKKEVLGDFYNMDCDIHLTGQQHTPAWSEYFATSQICTSVLDWLVRDQNQKKQ